MLVVYKHIGTEYYSKLASSVGLIYIRLMFCQ